MNHLLCADIFQGRPLPMADLPLMTGEAFRQQILDGVARGWRVASFFGQPTPDQSPPAPGAATGAATAAGPGPVILQAILADDQLNRLYALATRVDGPDFPSIAAACPQVQLFEREIAEQTGLVPRGHPWFKPVRYRPSWTGRDAWGRDPASPILPGVGEFYRVEGEAVHEVAVGPVHAGVIEPGHFRFQCHGEEVFHLEIALGYQHRGIEEALPGGPDARSLHLIENLAGDSTIAHTTCYCQLLETLGSGPVSPRAMALRAIALELERLANHIGDLGALSGDVGFLPTASYCGRIRGDVLNLTAWLCGNRFGRGMVLPGGVGFDLEPRRQAGFLERLDQAAADAADAINLLWENQSVMARLEDTGPVTRDQAVELGLVGPAARASGLVRDVRFDQPSGMYRFFQIPVATNPAGDVFARAHVRWLEILRSFEFVRGLVRTLPAGVLRQPPGALQPGSLAVALCEGWRGEVCHVAVTDSRGRLARYKVTDPSFHNWPGLALALRHQEISDFPLCNKSFNLSYCGHDL